MHTLITQCVVYINQIEMLILSRFIIFSAKGSKLDGS